MSEIVEAAARAIMPDAWHETIYPDGSKSFTIVLWEEEQEKARGYARNALNAIRRLTPELLNLIRDGEIVYPNEYGPFGDRRNHYYAPEEFWNAFIDEVLK